MSPDDALGPEPVPCPECGSWEQVELRRSGNHATMRCQECAHVWRDAQRRPRAREIALVVSDGAVSRQLRMVVADTDLIRVGDEFEAEGMRLLVTGLETPDGRNPRRARGDEVRVLAAKRFETVVVKYTANEGPTTRSLQETLDPDDAVSIGQQKEVDGIQVVVKTIKDDQNRTVRKGKVAARHIHRVFCDIVQPGMGPTAALAASRRVPARGRAPPPRRTTAARKKPGGGPKRTTGTAARKPPGSGSRGKPRAPGGAGRRRPY